MVFLKSFYRYLPFKSISLAPVLKKNFPTKMPLFSKSSTSGTTSSSSGIGSSDSTKAAKSSTATTTPAGSGGEDGTRPKSADEFAQGANLNRDTSDIFSGTFSLNGAPSNTSGSRMSSSFNQSSSSYNRTYERKVTEESTPTMSTTRLFSTSPLNTIKSTLGGSGGFPSDLGLGSGNIKSTLGGSVGGFPSELGLGSGNFVQPHNYQFGTATSGSFQSSDDALSASMDCAAFAPEELKVSVVGNQIVVEGRHGEKQDSLGTIERHFVRKFAMPRNATADSVNSNLTSDGMLTVTASAPKAKDNSPMRTIPVKIVTGAGGQQQQTQNGGSSSSSQFQQNGQ